jgi:hypothetical protein
VTAQRQQHSCTQYLQLDAETEPSGFCTQQVQQPARTALYISALETTRKSKKGDNSEFKLNACFCKR